MIKAQSKSTNPIIPDSLYELAFTYKKTKLWKSLWDTQLFAVQMADGEIGYCCIMGRNGEHTALAVYVGQNGIDAYRNLANGESFYVCDENGEEAPSLQSHEKWMSQDCIQCAFERSYDMRRQSIADVQDYAKRKGIKLAGIYPDFVRYKPCCYPWYVRDAVDQQYIAEALRAGIEVARRIEADVEQRQKENPSIAKRYARKAVLLELGLTEGAPYDKKIPLLKREADGSFTWSSMDLPNEMEKSYPSPTLAENDILLTRIKKAKRYINSLGRVGSWHCDIAMLPQPLSEEEYEGRDDGGAADLAVNSRRADDEDEIIAEPFEAPCFPMLLLAVDSESREIAATALIPKLDAEGCVQMIRDFGKTMVEKGKPSAFVIKESDIRTKTILREFVKQIGIAVKPCSDYDDVLLNAEMNMLSILDDDEDGMPDDDLDFNILKEQFMRISDADLQTMPKDMRDLLLCEAHAGRMDKELSERFIRLFEGK